MEEEWIIKRIKGIQDRKKLTDVWYENGVTTEVEYAVLTNEIYKEWSGMTAGEYKQYKGLRKESLRDNLSDIEIALADIGELAKKQKQIGLEESRKVARVGGEVAKNTRRDLEKKLGESVVKSNNTLNYQYKEENILEHKR